MGRPKWSTRTEDEKKVWHRKYSADWRKRNPEVARARSRESARRYRLNNKQTVSRKDKSRSRFRLYGITDDEYQRLVKAQSGLCAICYKPPSIKSLCVDHDHATGKIRGLLCQACNNGMGRLGDSASRLFDAAHYLIAAENRGL